MQIPFWYLDSNPAKAAQMLDDWDVFQMTVLSFQALSAAHYVLDSQPTKVTLKHKETGQDSEVMLHMFHDERDNFLSTFYEDSKAFSSLAIWTRQSVENYNWMVDHFFALVNEYQLRFENSMEDYRVRGFHLQSPPHGLQEWVWVEPGIVEDMRKAYKVGFDDRNWTHRDVPYWMG